MEGITAQLATSLGTVIYRADFQGTTVQPQVAATCANPLLATITQNRGISSLLRVVKELQPTIISKVRVDSVTEKVEHR